MDVWMMDGCCREIGMAFISSRVQGRLTILRICWAHITNLNDLFQMSLLQFIPPVCFKEPYILMRRSLIWHLYMTLL